MNRARICIRLLLSGWFIFSLALAYWIGLLLEAFELGISYVFAGRFTALGWFVSALGVWRLSTSNPKRLPSGWSKRFGWRAYFLCCALTLGLDLWLIVQGITSMSVWTLIPFFHATLSSALYFYYKEN